MSINSPVSYESFAKQVEILLKRVEGKFKNLSKKEAIRLLEFSLKFPVEHEEVVKKLTTPEQKELMGFITEVVTAKSNMVVTFLSEHGDELKKEAEKKQAEVIEEAEVVEKGCGGNCEDCNCKGD